MYDRQLVREYAARHHWVLEREWLLARGMSETTIDRELARGSLVAIHPGVYRDAAVPVTWQQQLYAATRGAPGSAVSRRAALAWWGIDGGVPGVVQLAVPRPLFHRLDGVDVHRVTDLHPHHVVVRDGIPITTPLRTLIDVAAVAPDWLVDKAYAHAVGKKLATRSAVEHMLDELSRRGRRGVGVMRRVLEARAGVPDTYGHLEARGAEILRRFGLPTGVPEYEIWQDGRFVAKVDRAWPEVRFCAEFDGDERHLGSTAADVERQNAIQEAGWDFRRFGYVHVTRQPEYVARTIERALADRARFLSRQPLVAAG